MIKISQARRFINEQKFYIYLAVFVAFVFAANAYFEGMEKLQKPPKPPETIKLVNELKQDKAKIEKLLTQKMELAVVLILAFYLGVLIFFIGIALDIGLFFRKIDPAKLIGRAPPGHPAKWGLWDVFKVVILFMFFGYTLTIVVAGFDFALPMFKSDNFKMLFNTAFVDVMAIFLVVYFVSVEYKEKLSALGLTVKNFTRNVLFGISGYVATMPILVLALCAVLWAATVTKYEPPPQPVFELFMKEKRLTALMILSAFVAVAGPVMEEIFFRGFMYNALKKKWGVIWAMVLSSALFSILHANLVGFLPIAILGILLAYLYERSGSLVPSITVHVLHNSAMIFFVLLMKEFRV